MLNETASLASFIDEKKVLIEQLISDKAAQQPLLTVMIASDYITEQCRSSPKVLESLLQSGDLDRTYQWADYVDHLESYRSSIDSIETLERILRHYRQREMIRLIWRDVLKLATIEKTLQETTWLADVCIEFGLNYLHENLAKRYGQPCNTQGEAQRLQVIAMGKLGGSELNLSSDIDLIFCYPDSGSTNDVKCSITNEQFFTKLAQQFIQVMNKITQDGFVFRVDMRLRPYGDSGPLVMNLSSIQAYFERSARQWERYAFVKARVLCGEVRLNENLMTLIQQFTYQHTADTKITKVLKEIKTKICEQVILQSQERNIKLGEGGIREIEFIVQVFQLIYAEHNANLRSTNLVYALAQLRERGYIDPKVACTLHEYYLFLRLLENRLQAFNDQQEHRLPTNPFCQARIAKTLDFTDWNALLIRLEEVQKFVSMQFAKIINQSLEEISVSKAESIRNINYQKQVKVEEFLEAWKQGSQIANLTNEALWDKFSERLIKESLKHTDPSAVAERTIRLLSTLIEQQPEILSELENHLEKLVIISSASQWLVMELMRFPELLVELVAKEQVELPVDLSEMEKLLQELINGENKNLTADELLSLLTQFKYEYTMRIAIADVLKQIQIMRVSDLLTDLAIVLLRQLLIYVWHELIEEYGKPFHTDGSVCELGFIIIAYGKLGGIELGYGSDLDLVFLHNADENALTQGKTEITGAQFYQRLGKQLVELLSGSTTIGRLYEIDTQLKPMGKSGILVNSFLSFENYQQHNAWTWEHQALVRARVIAGDELLKKEFDKLREKILSRPRDLTQLRREVVSMREKMLSEFPPGEGFRLKEDRGGITDIEFIAQYIVLAWAQRQPLLMMFPDNIRIFETAESAGLLSRKTVDRLCNTYRLYRTVVHHLTLQDKPSVMPQKRFKLLRQRIQHIWQFLLC